MKYINQHADQFAIDNKVSSLPVTLPMLKEIARNNKWHMYSYLEANRIIEFLNLKKYAKRHRAFAYNYKGRTYVLYDDELGVIDRNFAIAHEFGHIVLNHTVSGGILGKDKDPNQKAKQENEADAFAYEFLCPLCVMRKCKLKTLDAFLATGILEGDYALHQFSKCQTSNHYLTPVEASRLEIHKDFIKKNRKTAKNSFRPAIVIPVALLVVFLTAALAFQSAYYNNKFSGEIPPSPSPSASIAPSDGENGAQNGQSAEGYEQTSPPAESAAKPTQAAKTTNANQTNSASAKSSAPAPKTQPRTPAPPAPTQAPAPEPTQAPTPEPTPPPTEAPKQALKSGIPVWIVNGGSVYHLSPECYHISGQAWRQVDLDDATAMGLPVCDYCQSHYRQYH